MVARETTQHLCLFCFIPCKAVQSGIIAKADAVGGAVLQVPALWTHIFNATSQAMV